MEKENNLFFNELNCSLFKPNWENSMEQGDPFESALSSMVSSPTASNANGNNNGENIVLRELIGRLGSICNSGEISPHQNPNFINGSANTSCYSTPLNSPPKLNLSMRPQFQNPHFPSFATDPGFVERAARFSSFTSRGFSEIPPKLDSGKISRVSGSHPTPTVQENWDGSSKLSRLSRSSTPENGDSRENSSVSEQIAGAEIGTVAPNSRKRKSNPKGKGKESPATTTPAKDAPNVSASENSESSAKRSKSEDEKSGKKQSSSSKDNSKPPEAPKDYIHVRARRGQATDAHSLAERVRREKISERMKFLQDLVPGCNKVTGKAVMLDEIINYVQSLQRQVEFLSMKLSTVNPRMEFNMEALMSSKDIRGSLPHNMYPSDTYQFQPQHDLHNGIPPFPLNAALGRHHMENYSEAPSQVSSAFWEDDLHSIVQMGFGQNQTQNFQGIVPPGEMKVEL
ncbi:hypothetical protein ACS0TY_027541 [Phlomoides rotata]